MTTTVTEVAGLLVSGPVALLTGRAAPGGGDEPGEVDCVVRLEAPAPQLDGDRFRTLVSADSVPWVAVARTPAGPILRLTEVGDFAITRGGREIVCRPTAGVAEEEFARRLAGDVLPRVRAYRGGLVLHASAADDGRGVAAFMGPSHSGKSTLAARLGLAGWTLFADDALPVDHTGHEVRARPNCAGGVALRRGTEALLHLGADDLEAAPHAAGRSTVRGTTLARAPARLRVVYSLELAADGDPTTTERVEPRDAVALLARNAFRLDVEDADRIAREFEQLASSPLTGRVRRLRIAPGPRGLDAALAALAEDRE